MATMRPFTIRPATPDDAAGYNAHRRRIADEPDNGITYSAGEYTRFVEEDRERIKGIIAADNAHLIVAEAAGEIVGICDCSGGSNPARRHTVGLGIDVDVACRGQGIGLALMEAMISWARANPVVHRVELDVFTDNRRAINLYLKLGFVIEGRRQRAYFKYSRFIDAYHMALLVG